MRHAPDWQERDEFHARGVKSGYPIRDSALAHGRHAAKEPLPTEINPAKLNAAVEAAFQPAESLTAAFVVTWKGGSSPSATAQA